MLNYYALLCDSEWDFMCLIYLLCMRLSCRSYSSLWETWMCFLKLDGYRYCLSHLYTRIRVRIMNVLKLWEPINLSNDSDNSLTDKIQMGVPVTPQSVTVRLIASQWSEWWWGGAKYLRVEHASVLKSRSLQSFKQQTQIRLTVNKSH